jgi:N-methylhydantoinase A
MAQVPFDCRNVQLPSLFLRKLISIAFPRRAATTYFTAMTISEWNRFVDQIEEALKLRGIKAEVQVLKADGGTMPLAASRTKPCETAFSGPAASTMGGISPN